MARAKNKIDKFGIIPGKWSVESSAIIPPNVTLTMTKAGDVCGTGESDLGILKITGLRNETNLPLKMDYVDTHQAVVLEDLSGTWISSESPDLPIHVGKKGTAKQASAGKGKFTVEDAHVNYQPRDSSEQPQICFVGKDLNLYFGSGEVWIRQDSTPLPPQVLPGKTIEEAELVPGEKAKLRVVDMLIDACQSGRCVVTVEIANSLVIGARAPITMFMLEVDGHEHPPHSVDCKMSFTQEKPALATFRAEYVFLGVECKASSSITVCFCAGCSISSITRVVLKDAAYASCTGGNPYKSHLISAVVAEGGRSITGHIRDDDSSFTMTLKEATEISGAEMARVCFANANYLKEIVDAAFAKSDVNKDGMLSKTELRALSLSLHQQMGVEAPPVELIDDLSTYIDVGDCGNVGCLNREQFTDFFRMLLRRASPVRLPNSALFREATGSVWDRYLKGKHLGSGAFGAVYLCSEKMTGRQVAIKKIKCRGSSVEDAKDEFRVLRDLSHPNLMRVFEYYTGKDTMFLVSELADGGDLNSYIGKAKEDITERWIAGVMQQVLSGLSYCHMSKLVHHDIKPLNVLVMKEQIGDDLPLVVICDFGLAKIEAFRKDEPVPNQNALMGTLIYVPPEGHQGLSGPKTDVYACGVMQLQMLLGAPLEQNDIMRRDPWNSLAVATQEGLLDHVSAGGKEVTIAMLELLSKRVTCADALKHEWFEKPLAPSAVSKTVFNSLKRNCKKGFLKRVALNMLVSQFGRAALGDVLNVFKSLDKDKDGTLTFEELLEGLASGCGNACGWDENFARGVFQAADVGNCGYVDFREFAAVAFDLRSLSPEVLYGHVHALFQTMEKDGSGCVEFKEVFEHFDGADAADKANLKDAFKELDTNGDGKLSPEEVFTLFGLEYNPDWKPPTPLVVDEYEDKGIELNTPRERKRFQYDEYENTAKEKKRFQGAKVKTKEFTTVGAPKFAVRSGKWYYEVKLIKGYGGQFGWASDKFKCQSVFNQAIGVGDDECSWAVDGSRQCCWHAGAQSNLPGDHWNANDVIQFAIEMEAVSADCPTGKFAMQFSKNGEQWGKPIFQGPLQQKDGSSFEYMYAAATTAGGEFEFNITSDAFKHSPPDESYKAIADCPQRKQSSSK